MPDTFTVPPIDCDPPAPPAWIIAAIGAGDVLVCADYVEVRTHAGPMRAVTGDRVERGADGALRVVQAEMAR